VLRTWFRVAAVVSIVAAATHVVAIHAGKRALARATERWVRAFFFVAGKFPEALGQMKSWLLHARHRRAGLIEYK